MKKIYVAGALNSDAVGYIKNMHRMIKAAVMVRNAGYAVFVPCLDILCGLYAGDWGYEEYFDNSQPWLLSADAVFVVPKSEKSKGTQAEIGTANLNNIPVFYNLPALMENIRHE